MQIHRLELDRPRLTRSRRVQACQQCRDSRVKCDRAKPSCRACTIHNRVCVYHILPQSHANEEDQTASASRNSFPPVPHTPKALYEDRGRDSSVETTYRSRYISDVSWLCALNQDQPNLPVRVSADPASILVSQTFDQPGADRLSPAQYSRLFSPQNTDALMDRYEQCCHVWYPIVSPSEMRVTLATCREVDARDSGSAALTVAICYIASKAAQAYGHSVPSLLACAE